MDDYYYGESQLWEPNEETQYEQQLLKKLKTVKERVEYLLEKYPDARNSDLYLTILYLRKFTPLGKYIKYIPYRVIKEYDGIFESIRRARQYIQNTMGKYPPTDPEVLAKRMKKKKSMERIMGKNMI